MSSIRDRSAGADRGTRTGADPKTGAQRSVAEDPGRGGGRTAAEDRAPLTGDVPGARTGAGGSRRRLRDGLPSGRRMRRRGGAAAALMACAIALTGCSLPFSLFGEKQAPLPAEPEASIESFAAQQPVWQGCHSDMECADVYAPLDWTDPGGERITLHLVKQPARGGDPLGTLFVNPGGPGASGAEYIAESIDWAVSDAVQQRYDVIGWDPRGVGDSSPVSCLSASDMDDYLFGAGSGADLEVGSDEWIEAGLADATEFGESCAESTGELIGHVDTRSTVRDLDMLRAIVGDEKLHYLGFSYGTYIGALYADAFPERVGRVVLDGAMDPAASVQDVVREQTRGFELALRAYLSDCLGRDDCPFSGTVDSSMQDIGGLLDRVDTAPLEGSDGRRLQAGTMLTAIITPLYNQSNWPYLDELFVSVDEGSADTALALADFYYGRENGEYGDNSNEAFMAINCLDYPNELDPQRMREDAAELEEVAPTLGRFQGYGDIGCAGWPVQGAEPRGPVTAAGADPILVVGTTGDPATPYRWAESLAEQLESGVLVTYVGEGHTAYTTSSCVGETVDAYLLDGAVPASDPRCAA